MAKTPVLTEPTALQSAIHAHTVAVADLETHRATMKALRLRIAELRAIISDMAGKASKSLSLATMTLEQIKTLSGEKRAAYEEMASLNAALDIALVELCELERGEQGHRLLIDDCLRHCWHTLFHDLVKALDTGAIARLLAAGGMAGLTRAEMVEATFGFHDGFDVEVAESLSATLGLPL